MIMDEIKKLEACIQKLHTEREVELESRRRMSSDPRRKHSFGQFEIIKISEWVGKSDWISSIEACIRFCVFMSLNIHRPTSNFPA